MVDIDYRDEPPSHHEDAPQPGDIVQLGDGLIVRIMAAKDEGSLNPPLYTVAKRLRSKPNEETPNLDISGHGIRKVVIGADSVEYLNDTKVDIAYRNVLEAEGMQEASELIGKVKQLSHVETKGWYGDRDG